MSGPHDAVVLVPTRGEIHQDAVDSFERLQAPPGARRAFLLASGHEVGLAYDAMIQKVLDDPVLSTFPWLLTLEDDNLPPPDAHLLLLETAEHGGFDAVSGIYFTKGPISMPMAYGDPQEYATTGVLDFRPRDVRQALARGAVMPVNGIAMGCALWRTAMFRDVPPPWFVTMADVVPGQGARCFTQDLSFCSKAVAPPHSKRFAVDFRVRVGHMDVSTGAVY